MPGQAYLTIPGTGASSDNVDDILPLDAIGIGTHNKSSVKGYR